MTDKKSGQPRSVKYPHVKVRLTGADGNVFALIGRVARALREAGEGDGADALWAEVREMTSYDDVLALLMRTVDVS